MSGSKVFKLFGSVIAAKPAISKAEGTSSTPPNGVSSPSNCVASPVHLPVSSSQNPTNTEDLPITVMTDSLYTAPTNTLHYHMNAPSTSTSSNLSTICDTSPSTTDNIKIKQEPIFSIVEEPQHTADALPPSDLSGISNSTIKSEHSTPPIKSPRSSAPAICITDSVIVDALANCTGEDKKTKSGEKKDVLAINGHAGKANDRWYGRNNKEYGLKEHKKEFLGNHNTKYQHNSTQYKGKFDGGGKSSWSNGLDHRYPKHSISQGRRASRYSPSPPPPSSSYGRKRSHSPSRYPSPKRYHSSRSPNISPHSPPYDDRLPYRSRFETDDPYYPLHDPPYPPPLPYVYPFADEFSLSSALSLPYPPPYPPAFLPPPSLPSPLYPPFANFYDSPRDDHDWGNRGRKIEREERRDRGDKHEWRERERDEIGMGREDRGRRERHDEFEVKEGTKLYLHNAHFSDEELLRLFEGVAKVRATSTGRRAFCFVFFETQRDRDKAAEYLAKFHPEIIVQASHTTHYDSKLLREDKLKRTPSQCLYVGLANCDSGFDIWHALRDFRDEVVEMRPQKNHVFVVLRSLEGAIRVKEFFSKYYPKLQVNYHVRKKHN
eukprot:Phypoly_transcript_05364.p1 GENE.Phypoly_transcript_05364~~Phypoly_transcript_05364.p1  ORF type:complete len:620 (+),score=85.04 Phypoly_transcript_05364:53-1861(+)